MTGDHALGQAGGAGGEQDIEPILRSDRRTSPLHFGCIVSLAAGEEFLPAEFVGLGVAQHDDTTQTARSMRGKQRRVMLSQEIAGGEQQTRTALLQDIAGLVATHARVDRHQHRADAVNRKPGNDPLDTVLRPDRHAVAVRDAMRDQGTRGT